MNSRKKQNDAIDLVALMRVMKDKVIWILLSAIIFGGIGYVVSAFVLTPKYEASINMIVNNQKNASTTATGDSLNSAQRLVDTYAVVIKSNTVLNQVIKELNLETSYEQLNSQVSVSSVNGTQVMKISVKATDQETACEVVKAIADVSVDQVSEAVEAGSCKIVSDVYATGQPVYPDVQRNTLKAALLGIILCAGLFTLQYLMDNTFRSEEDIRNELDIPVLGVIPAVECCGGNPSKAGRKEKSKA